jgi:hypothetical protein
MFMTVYRPDSPELVCEADVLAKASGQDRNADNRYLPPELGLMHIRVVPPDLWQQHQQAQERLREILREIYACPKPVLALAVEASPQ